MVEKRERLVEKWEKSKKARESEIIVIEDESRELRERYG